MQRGVLGEQSVHRRLGGRTEPPPRVIDEPGERARSESVQMLDLAASP